MKKETYYIVSDKDVIEYSTNLSSIKEAEDYIVTYLDKRGEDYEIVKYSVCAETVKCFQTSPTKPTQKLLCFPTWYTSRIKFIDNEIHCNIEAEIETRIGVWPDTEFHFKPIIITKMEFKEVE